MTIGTLTLFALTGSLVFFKLALMALAVALLARTLFPNQQDARLTTRGGAHADTRQRTALTACCRGR